MPIQSSPLTEFSFSSMATLRNERKQAAVLRETPENTRNAQSRNIIDPEIAQEYISQVSEEIEGRVTQKLSKEFSRTESRILGALSKLDDFFLNPQFPTCSVAVPGTSRNRNSENREPTGDRCLTDPCPEVGFSSHHFGNLISSEVEDYPHMVTGVQEEIRNRSHMRTGIKQEIPYCSLGISAGKQKKARSTSQPHFCSENTPAIIEADQILLALQQLASNSNSATPPTSTTTLTKIQKGLNPSQKQCPLSTGNQRNLNCLKIYSKRV